MAEHDFQTVASETVYSGKILALRTDAVRMPGGVTAEREVVEHDGAVGVDEAQRRIDQTETLERGVDEPRGAQKPDPGVDADEE